MKRVVLILGLSMVLTACTTGSKLLSEIDDVPKWFLDKLPEAEAAGYPTLASTPQVPNDVPGLASWDAKLQQLESKGVQVENEARDHEQEVADLQSTAEFLDSSLSRADIDKFNAEEAAAEDAAKAKP